MLRCTLASGSRTGATGPARCGVMRRAMRARTRRVAEDFGGDGGGADGDAGAAASSAVAGSGTGGAAGWCRSVIRSPPSSEDSPAGTRVAARCHDGTKIASAPSCAGAASEYPADGARGRGMAGWSRRPRAWVAVAAYLLAWSASVTASGAVPTGAAPVVAGTPQDRGASLRVLQMNLCDSGAARCYTGRSVAEAGEVIRAQSPDVVTVNEVCRDDVTALGHALAGTGGGGVVVSAFQAAWDRRTGAALTCRNGRPYGIGLVARLAPVPQWYATVGGIYPVQDPGNAEERAWVCLSPAPGSALPVTAVAVCTTHLASSNPAVARAQCGYLLGT